MLRVGLTGGLGSGKSTVGSMLAQRGAYVLQADEIGRAMMEPGQAVYRAIVERFGAGVVKGGGRRAGELDRAELARIAFTEGRVEELNAIVHPAVIARQGEMTEEITRRDPGAVVVVESALIFETKHGAPDGWRTRFDRLILVTAPRDLMLKRYLERVQSRRAELPVEARELAASDARRRMALQMPDEEKAAFCDYFLWNGGDLSELERAVEELWPVLKKAAMAG